MTGLDIEGVLAGHPWGFDDDDRVACWCGAKFGLNMLDYYAHVAAVLREQITAAQAEAWDEGFDAGDRTARAVNDEWPEPTVNPYRAALVAPSRVPGEET